MPPRQILRDDGAWRTNDEAGYDLFLACQTFAFDQIGVILNEPLVMHALERKATAMPLETASTETSTTESKETDALPNVPFADEDWRERIARAKQARKEGRKARQGKPLTFRTRYNIK